MMTSGASWLKGQGGGLWGRFTNTYLITPLEHAIVMKKNQASIT